MILQILIALAGGYGVGRLNIWTTKQAMLGLFITLPCMVLIGFEPVSTLLIVIGLGVGFLVADR